MGRKSIAQDTYIGDLQERAKAVHTTSMTLTLADIEQSLIPRSAKSYLSIVRLWLE
jgi:hypothetical protein